MYNIPMTWNRTYTSPLGIAQEQLDIADQLYHQVAPEFGNTPTQEQYLFALMSAWEYIDELLSTIERSVTVPPLDN